MRNTLRLLALILTSVPLQLASLGAQGVVPVGEDYRGQKGVTLAVMADANFTAKKMALDFCEIKGSSALDSFNLSYDIISKTYDTASPFSISGIIQILQGSEYSISPFGWIFSAAQIVWTYILPTFNTSIRNYALTAPVAGFYKLKAWVPGGILKPCSLIKVHVVENFPVPRQVYSYDQTNSNDTTVSIGLFLPAGVTHVSVALGSGSAALYTAGHLVEVMLDDGEYHQWSVPSVTIAKNSFNIAPNLPSVGSTFTASLNFANPGVTANLLEGSVTYSNPWVSAFIEDLPPAETNGYLPPPPRPGAQRPDEEPNGLPNVIYHRYYMDAILLPTPTINGQTATFTFKRLGDFLSVENIYYVSNGGAVR